MGNILSIDQSLSESGYAIFSPEGILLDSGVIKTKTNPNLISRLTLIVDAVNILIDDFNIDTLLLETPVSRFVKTTRLLTSLYAVLTWEFRHLEVHTIHNQVVKKFCCLKTAKIKKGNGKNNVADYCNKVLKTNEFNQNITDALGIYLTWRN